MRAKIALIATGGTISAVADARRSVGGGWDAETIASQDDLSRLADLLPVDVARLPSRAMTPSLMRDLAVVVQSEAARGCDGIVITHGTDTMEETTYSNLGHGKVIPVAAQRAGVKAGGSLDPKVVRRDEANWIAYRGRIRFAQIGQQTLSVFGMSI